MHVFTHQLESVYSAPPILGNAAISTWNLHGHEIYHLKVRIDIQQKDTKVKILLNARKKKKQIAIRQNSWKVCVRMVGVLDSLLTLSSFFPPFSFLPGRLACMDCPKGLLCFRLGIGLRDVGRRMRLGFYFPSSFFTTSPCLVVTL